MKITHADRTIVLIHTHNPPGFPSASRKAERKHQPEDVDEALALFEGGHTAHEVSAILEIPLGTIKTWKRRAGMTESRK